ncbi:scoloptoxin SSD14-like [Oppia nitens]|uniref:scoloptoxin SSD14-like n=1 Tax=Oppia nitens TaxID=1686743 RepID=UPI0023DBD4C0|nr:scoloptoxin SSD14-like [Oppia nitens]
MSEKSKLIRDETLDNTSSKRYGSVSYKYTLIDSVPKTHFTKKQCILVTISLIVIIIAFSVTLILGLPKLRQKRSQYLKGEFIVSDAQEVRFSSSAVVVDGEPCAGIARDILSRNGSAVDAAIALLFCDEIANPQSSGIGGGFLMIVYNRANNTSEVIDARETAPKNVDFINLLKNDSSLLQSDGPSIAIPGQLRGMILAHQRYGKLSWSSLIEPSIAMARNGINVTKHLEEILIQFKDDIEMNDNLKEIFKNNETNSLYKSGEILKREKLAETLEVIAKNPEDFYNGSIASKLVEDIKALNGFITLEDMKSYTVKVRQPIKVSLRGGDYTLLTVPPPGSGSVVALILNILNEFNHTCDQQLDVNNRTLVFHRFIEALKFAFGQRLLLGDPDFVNNTEILKNMTSFSYAKSIKENIQETAQQTSYYGLTEQVINDNDEGMGHISVIGTNGDTVSVTSSINSVFGSKSISKSTGIVLNNEMKDFAVEVNGEPSVTSANAIQGGKRPLTSMSPTIIVDSNGNTKFAIGSIGGTRIVSSISQVLYQILWGCHTLKEATDMSRLYYDITTNTVLYESNFPKVYIDGLYHFGHYLETEQLVSSVYTILNTNSSFVTFIDHRKGGSSDGF